MPQPNTGPIESLFIRIHSKPSLIVGAVYITPKTKITEEHLDNLTAHPSPFIIGGDFNAKHTLWNNCTNNRLGNTLHKHLHKNNYHIEHSNTFSHQAPRANPSNIDFFFSNLSFHTKCTTINELSSNHLPVLCEIENQIKPFTNYTITNTNWDNYRAICNRLQINSNIHTEHDITSEIDRLGKTLKSAFHKSTSTTKAYSRTIKPDQELINLIKLRNRYRRKFQKTGNSLHKFLRNSLTKLIQDKIWEIKKDSWGRKLQALNNDNSNASTWKIYKAIKSNTQIIPPLTSDLTTAYTDLEKANILAQQFANVHKQTSDSCSPFDQQATSTLEAISSAETELDCSFITPRYIRDLITKLPKGKSPGQDHITADLLKNAPTKIIVQLYYIFKKATILAHFPDCWKDATILPIKKPNKSSTLPSSYRPISLLSLLGKLLEKIILSTIHKHLADNHIIINEQFGFQHNHSTIMQYLGLLNTPPWKLTKIAPL